MTAEDIVKFILDNDYEDMFLSAKKNPNNFLNAVQKMLDVKQVVVFDTNGSLDGVCGYVFLNEKNKSEVSKITWRLPENITDGDILYVSFVLLKDTSVFKLKDWFDKNVRHKIRKVKWYYKGMVYEKKVAQGDRNA